MVVEMRAEAPAFVPNTAPLSQPLPQEPAAGQAEMVGDRLIRQLAAAMVPLPAPSAPSAVPSAASTAAQIKAAGLFCPYCAAGGPCSFHQPSTAGWEVLKLSAAGFACMQAGHFRDRKPEESEDPARRSLPPAPPGPPPSPPAVPCGDAGSMSRDYFCTECGSSTGTCLCHPSSAGGVAQLLGEGRREGPGKSGTAELEDFGKDVTWLEDVSTDAGGSEPTCAESDVSDASLTGVAARRGRGGLQKLPAAQHSTLPYMSTVWMPNVRAAAGAADGAGRSAAVWYPARHGASWGTGAR